MGDNMRDNITIREHIELRLRGDSWENLFRVIRHEDTTLTGDTSNFWASIQHLEQQLDDRVSDAVQDTDESKRTHGLSLIENAVTSIHRGMEIGLFTRSELDMVETLMSKVLDMTHNHIRAANERN